MNFLEQEIRQLLARVKNLKGDELTVVDKRLANKLGSRLEDCLFIAPHVLRPADGPEKSDVRTDTQKAVQAPHAPSGVATGPCICPMGAVDNACPVHGAKF